jgi:non-ribosomal peptide synthetase component E (peptide arylation enzyme)
MGDRLTSGLAKAGITSLDNNKLIFKFVARGKCVKARLRQAAAPLAAIFGYRKKQMNKKMKIET